jgi:hypothetical protein
LRRRNARGLLDIIETAVEDKESTAVGGVLQ